MVAASGIFIEDLPSLSFFFLVLLLREQSQLFNGELLESSMSPWVLLAPQLEVLAHTTSVLSVEC